MTSPENSGSESKLHKGGLRSGVVVFLVMIVAPLVISFSSTRGRRAIEYHGESLRGRLQQIENSVAKMPVFESMRRRDQRRLSEWLRLGNARVVVGADDYLHLRADMDAVVGKGPFYEEPPSVAREPGLADWEHPVPVIQEFASQLKERGIELCLVPIPTKAMMVSLAGAERAMVPSSYAEVIEPIRAAGVEVFDVVDVMREPGSFLERDTHWTPEAMERVAAASAERMGGAIDSSMVVEPRSGSFSGDLARMLGDRGKYEEVALNQVRDQHGSLVASEPGADWILLGDSFVNVFDDPYLGLHEMANEGRIGAGFASHFRRQLGRPLQVMAVNGGGATEVRKALAAMPVEDLAKKKKVIWVLSARDLLLAEKAGRRSGIVWERVIFSDRSSSLESVSDEVTITAALREVSAIGDPKITPYESALYSVVFDEVRADQGGYASSEAYVFLWAFRDRELVDSGRLKVGKRYRMQLRAFPTEGRAAHAKQLDDLFRVDLDRWFAESVEEVTANE